MFTYKMIVNVVSAEEAKSGGRSKKEAEDGGNGGWGSLCAHHHRRVVGSQGIIFDHPTFMIGVGYILVLPPL